MRTHYPTRVGDRSRYAGLAAHVERVHVRSRVAEIEPGQGREVTRECPHSGQMSTRRRGSEEALQKGDGFAAAFGGLLVPDVVADDLPVPGRPRRGVDLCQLAIDDVDTLGGLELVARAGD